MPGEARGIKLACKLIQLNRKLKTLSPANAGPAGTKASRFASAELSRR